MNKPIEELIQRLKEPDYKYYGCELSRGEAELAISALEKQIPIKGIHYYSYKNHIFVECGACHKNMDMYYDYCPKCGQKSDWSVEE